MLSSSDYACGKASDFIALVTYTPAESDTIIVRRFAKSSNFALQKNTLLIDKPNTNLQVNGDTVFTLIS